ncbi:MAG: nucleoside/nucleotide kinase family protein, partial [Proteobacteria bacterium]|nr:nucleoside/nucleotide kinase family protein [Pseudomonadota bacterium]
MSFPVFDRDADQTIMDADNLGPEHKIIIIEGN